MARAKLKALPSRIGTAELDSLSEEQRQSATALLCESASEVLSDYYNVNREAWQKFTESAAIRCKTPISDD